MAHGHSDVGRLLDDAGYARATAESLQALATPSRLRILARLHAGPAAVGDLAAAIGLEASAVSHQLRILRHLGLVIGERDEVLDLIEFHVRPPMSRTLTASQLRNNPRGDAF